MSVAFIYLRQHMIGVIVQSSSAHTAKHSGAAAMSRAGSANRTWVQIHLGEEPADAGGTREFVSLPHPRTGKDCRYMLRGESVLELQIGVCSGRFLYE